MRSRTWIAAFTTLAALAALAQAGCGAAPHTESASTLTERQRDSVIAASSLPGAQVVERAMSESDRAARRAARMDSLTH